MTPRPCKGWGCVENAPTYDDYCLRCMIVRKQTAYSHEAEGHTDAVRNCPTCELLERIGAR